MKDDHLKWKKFFESVSIEYADANTVIKEWKCYVHYHEIDMTTIRDLVDTDRVGDIPDLFPRCKYRHLLASRLITFNS